MASTWVPLTQTVLPQAIDAVSTTQNLPLGTRVKAKHTTLGEAEFIYVKGVSGGAAGAWAVYNADDYSTTLVVADAIGPVGVMMAALDAATDYGWLCVYGKVSGAQCLTSFSDNGVVFATACAGFVDDASVTGDLVNRAKGASTSTARSADFEIDYPYVDNNSDATPQ